MLDRFDEHMFGGHSAMNDARAVSGTQGRQQPPPHPGHIARVQTRWIRRHHFGQRDEAGQIPQHIGRAFGATGGIFVGERVEQFRKERLVDRLDRERQGAQGLRLGRQQICAIDATSDLEDGSRGIVIFLELDQEQTRDIALG